jgi:hypothetical protein
MLIQVFNRFQRINIVLLNCFVSFLQVKLKLMRTAEQAKYNVIISIISLRMPSFSYSMVSAIQHVFHFLSTSAVGYDINN